MDYPKLPIGPTPAGAAGVRGLQSEGGEFQRTRRTVDTESKKSDDFSRATVEGAEYVVGGTHDDTKYKYRAHQRYIMPAVPSVASSANVNMGRGRYVAWQAPEFNYELLTFSYTIRPGDNRTYQIDRFSADRGIRIGGFYGKGPQIGGVVFEVYVQKTVNVYYPNVPSLTLTRPAPPQPESQQLAVFMLGDNGRVDSVGRKLQDIFLLSFYRDKPTIERYITTTAFTRADAEFSPFIPTVATKNCTYAIVAEQFFKFGEYPGSADPKVFILRANNHNLDAPSISDVTTTMVEDRSLPIPVDIGGDYFWLPTAGNGFAADLSRMMTSIRLVAMPDDWVLCFYRVFCNEMGDLKWRARMVRFKGTSGLTITRVLDEELPSDTRGVFYQSAVHLGENWVLTKRVEGFDGFNFDVKFTRSTDGGLTWVDVPMVGFHSPAKNQFFGDLVVHKPRKDGESGVVLITAWDSNEQAYYVYESADDGTSWTRKGRIYKPDTFRRVDQMLIDDTGGNFETLIPGPDPVRPVDVTIPDRYKPVE